MSVELAPIPHEVQHLVVTGAPVRKSPTIIAAWLKSLAWQSRPHNVQQFFLFIDDGCIPDARALLDAFVQEHGGLVWEGEPAPPGDFSDTEATHVWTASAMDRVGRAKDRILEFARVNRAEAVWLVDADLICDPMTLASLWSVPDPITAAVYWTRWSRVPEGSPPLHAGPQVWLTHPYGLSGNGMDEAEFRRRLIDRQLTQVFGLGACTLIRRDALMKGVSFAPWPANTMQGIGAGEDRHFCLRADALHLKLTADPWPDIFHIYHRPDDEMKIEGMSWRLFHSHARPSADVDTPGANDLVSLELQALEPVPVNGGWHHAPAQFVRGRLSRLVIHPELEQAILEMRRGEVRIVPVHFGLDYPFPPYRGQRRLIRVRLIDHKPLGYPPVIEDELIRNDAGSVLDTTQFPPETLDLMREIHA